MVESSDDGHKTIDQLLILAGKPGCDGRSTIRTFGPTALLILKPYKFASWVEMHAKFNVNMKLSIYNDRRSKPPSAAQCQSLHWAENAELPFSLSA
jgi:hypothetical protein